MTVLAKERIGTPKPINNETEAHEIETPKPTDSMYRRAKLARRLPRYLGFAGFPDDDGSIIQRHNRIWKPLKVGIAAVAGAALVLGGAKYVFEESQEAAAAEAANALLTDGYVQVNTPFVLAHRNVRKAPVADYGEDSSICGDYGTPQPVQEGDIKPAKGHPGWFEISGASREAVDGCGGILGSSIFKPGSVFVYEVNIAFPDGWSVGD
jgi:hypothetical protein